MVCAPSVLAYYGKLPYYSIRLGRRDGKARVTHRGQGAAIGAEGLRPLTTPAVPAVALSEERKQTHAGADMAAAAAVLVVAVTTAAGAPRGPRGVAAKIAPVQIGVAISTSAAFQAGLWAGGGGEGDTPPSPGSAAPSRTTVYPPPRPARSREWPIGRLGAPGESSIDGGRRSIFSPIQLPGNYRQRRPAAGQEAGWRRRVLSPILPEAATVAGRSLKCPAHFEVGW